MSTQVAQVLGSTRWNVAFIPAILQVADACFLIERRGRFHELSRWTSALQELVLHDGLRIMLEVKPSFDLSRSILEREASRYFSVQRGMRTPLFQSKRHQDIIS